MTVTIKHRDGRDYTHNGVTRVDQTAGELVYIRHATWVATYEPTDVLRIVIDA